MKRSQFLLDRRTALAGLAAAGVGLAGGRTMPLAAHPQANNPLGNLRPKSREKLRHLVGQTGFDGRISVDEVRGLTGDDGKSVDALMVDLLPLAKTYSRPPISNYYVGAVVRGASGSLYLGANFEVPGQALGFSVHAEQAALSNAYMHGEQSVRSIAVSAAPCGHCRQFMNEMSLDGEIQVLIAGEKPTSLSRLLPMAFGPKDLKLSRGVFPPTEVELREPSRSSDDLTAAALQAARRSWAPYTKAHSGVAVKSRGGHIAAGSYIENAAFNPSLPPLETALVMLVLSGAAAADITRAVLVEPQGAVISQERNTATVLEAVAPGAKLDVVLVTSA